MVSPVLGDGFSRGEGFAGVGQQVFVFGVRGDGVHGAGAGGRWGGAGCAEVVVEGGFWLGCRQWSKDL